MRKSMATEALSSVIQVCGATSKTRSRRSTRMPLSMNGKSNTRPGPRAPTRRPRRSTTSRWYSGTTRIASDTTRKAKTMTSNRMTNGISPPPVFGVLCGRYLRLWDIDQPPLVGAVNLERDAFYANDLHGLTGRDRLELRDGGPILVVYAHRAPRLQIRGRDTLLAHQG